MLSPTVRTCVAARTWASTQWLFTTRAIDCRLALFQAGVIERKSPGVSTGAEEHKLGIRGSSTRQVILEDVFVPADQVLGKVGQGHKIAFNILNVGRFKLGAGAVGAGRARLLLACVGDRFRYGDGFSSRPSSVTE